VGVGCEGAARAPDDVGVACAPAPQLVALGKLPGERQAELSAGRERGVFRTR